MADLNFTELLETAKPQGWYAFALFVVFALMQLLKTRADLWARVPARLQPAIPILLGTAAGIIDALTGDASWVDGVVRAVTAGGYVGVGAVGVFEVFRRFRSGARSDMGGGTGPDSIPVTTVLFVALSLASGLQGCAVPLESARAVRAPSSETGASTAAARDVRRCQTLDDRRTLWGGIATGAVALSGGSGLSSIPFEDDTAKVALAASAVTLAVVAGSAHYVEQATTESWARECSGAN